jgi:hypothetical protein
MERALPDGDGNRGGHATLLTVHVCKNGGIVAQPPMRVKYRGGEFRNDLSIEAGLDVRDVST